MAFPKWFKPASWGAVVGAITLAIVSSSSGLVVSEDSAKQMAKNQSDKAVLAALTPICVAQFKNEARNGLGKLWRGETGASNAQGVMLAALKKEDEWKRGDFVTKKGWATMPGSIKPNTEVARACAAELVKLAK